MRIAIDARLNAYRQGGIPQYTRQLLTALAEVAHEDEIISLQHRDQIRPLAIAPNVVRRTAYTPPHHRYEPWALPLELLLTGADVLHFPDFIAPLRRHRPAVVTIHDLAFLHYPEILDDAARAYYGQVTTNTPRADAVIAVSEATRQDIAQYLDIPLEQIDVIYEAAAPLYSRMDLRLGEARVLNRTPLAARSFMLFVSTLEPRKNLPTLLRALRVCVDRQPGRPYLLVIAGGRGWRDEAIFQAVRDLRLADYVLFAGNVGQYDLRWLYNACKFYVNPSLYEGFGLPLLEAMACGAACLAAATSSLPEIGGDAAIYLPPLDIELWADAIEELWDDEEHQQELGRLGHARSRRFSWARAARETLKVYARVVERSRGRPTAPPQPVRDHSLAGSQVGDSAPVVRLAPAPSLDAGRDCPRCGARLLAGQFLQGVTIERPGTSADQDLPEPYGWVCPNCSHVVLIAQEIARSPKQLTLPGVGPGESVATTAEDPEAQTVSDDLAAEAETAPDLADEPYADAQAYDLSDRADEFVPADPPAADPRATSLLPIIDAPDESFADAQANDVSERADESVPAEDQFAPADSQPLDADEFAPATDPRATSLLPIIDAPDDHPLDDADDQRVPADPPAADPRATSVLPIIDAPDDLAAPADADEFAPADTHPVDDGDIGPTEETSKLAQGNGVALSGPYSTHPAPASTPTPGAVARAQKSRSRGEQADSEHSRGIQPSRPVPLDGSAPGAGGAAPDGAAPSRQRKSRSKRKRS